MKFFKKINKVSIITVLVIALMLGFTPPIPAHAAISPSLGEAGYFSVIGATGITGTATITKDVGNPAGAQITDLTAEMVGGRIYSSDNIAPGLATLNPDVLPNLSTAYDNLDSAIYNNSAASCLKASDGSSGTDIGVIELGGKSLPPGVYCTAGSFEITGHLTLSGTTGTWVFKSATGLTTMTDSLVTGGDPCNVWWRIGTAAAGLGTNSTFIGTIIANTGITFGTGVTLNGRALAKGANVTLNSGGHISGPTCTAPSSDLSLTKTVDDATPSVGDNIVYTITVTNGGPDAATGVVVTDLLPAGLSWVSDDSSGTYIPGTGVWTVGTIANGASKTLAITATVDTGTGGETIANTAEITTSDEADADSTPDNHDITEDDQDSVDVVVNTDPSTLKLVKAVTNDNGGAEFNTAWTLTATGAGGFSDNGGTGIFHTVTAGVGYLLSESPVIDGYTAGSWSCDGESLSGSTITLSSGQNVTCTINNNDITPTLTLEKVVVGGSDDATDWTLTAAGPTGFSGVGPTVNNGASFDAGTYNLSETGPAGYTASDWVCVGGTTVDSDTVSLALGESATCTITNTYIDPGSSGGGTVFGCKDPAATNYNAFSSSRPELCVYENIEIVAPPFTPLLPKTGFPPRESNTWYEFLFNNILNLFR